MPNNVQHRDSAPHGAPSVGSHLQRLAADLPPAMGAEQSSEAAGGGLVAAALAPSSTKHVDKNPDGSSPRTDTAIVYLNASAPAILVIDSGDAEEAEPVGS